MIATKRYIYSFNYNFHHSDLCKLESRQIFGREAKDKILFSDVCIEPSVSAFIKSRLEIITSADHYEQLIENIKNEHIQVNGFKAEYVNLTGDSAGFTERRQKEKDVGYAIDGEPSFKSPSITYGICTYDQKWYFGVLTKQQTGWHKHKQKPRSFSNSISLKIAKTLVSIAAEGNTAKTLLDACCGVGTIMLEARYSGFNIEGCDINLNATHFTKRNLAHFGYEAIVHCSDVKDLDKKYDAAIIDLPYNFYSVSDESVTENIIQSGAKLAPRLVIVSISDIKSMIEKSGLKVVDFCIVAKRGKSKFSRNIWVCEKV